MFSKYQNKKLLKQEMAINITSYYIFGIIIKRIVQGNALYCIIHVIIITINVSGFS